MNKDKRRKKNGDRADLWGVEKWPICAKHYGWKDEKWGRDWGRKRNLIYWKYYKLHLCITPQNYQPIKAECLLLSHYMEIRSHSESMSRQGGRGGDKRRGEEERGGKERRARARETDKRFPAVAATVNAPLCKQKNKELSHKRDDCK